MVRCAGVAGLEREAVDESGRRLATRAGDFDGAGAGATRLGDNAGKRGARRPSERTPQPSPRKPMQCSARSVLLVALPVLGCGSAPERPAAPSSEHAVHLPPSAFATAVRALEALEAHRPPDVLLQVRALESDVLAGPGGEHVRLFLHVTAYAATAERAGAAFEELRARLESEALATAPAAPAHVVSALAAVDWTPEGREDLVSYSDAIRVEVAAGAASTRSGAPAAGDGAHAAESLGEWVRGVAARELAGPVVLDVQPRAAPAGTAEVRCRIRAFDAAGRHSRGEIGDFLASLESESPAARLTHVKLERSQHEPDPHAVRGWTFAAELTVRVPSGEARVAGPGEGASAR
jgi:hypothetical protein